MGRSRANSERVCRQRPQGRAGGLASVTTATAWGRRRPAEAAADMALRSAQMESAGMHVLDVGGGVDRAVLHQQGGADREVAVGGVGVGAGGRGGGDEGFPVHEETTVTRPCDTVPDPRPGARRPAVASPPSSFRRSTVLARTFNGLTPPADGQEIAWHAGGEALGSAGPADHPLHRGGRHRARTSGGPPAASSTARSRRSTAARGRSPGSRCWPERRPTTRPATGSPRTPSTPSSTTGSRSRGRSPRRSAAASAA